MPAKAAQGLADLEDDVLALAEHHGIEEVRERLGVQDDRPARDDERIVSCRDRD